mmetsp:Transcript_31217/g.99193  ORF Transcript_31217/g.99193 Transcript_31217/m.99193 type:complete len:233 (+) Transcript_31217:237-935(+)
MLSIAEICGCGGGKPENSNGDSPVDGAGGDSASETRQSDARRKARPHYNRGCVLQDHEQLEEAIRAYQTAISLDSKYEDAYFNLGSALLAKGDLGAAATACEAAIRLRPDYTAAYYNLGYIRQDQDRLNDAIRAFSRAVYYEPNDAEGWIHLGNVLRAKETPAEMQRAIDAYRKAVEVQNNNVMAHYNLGAGLQDIGDVEGAIESFMIALEMDPDNVDALYNLGLCHEEKKE